MEAILQIKILLRPYILLMN